MIAFSCSCFAAPGDSGIRFSGDAEAADLLVSVRMFSLSLTKICHRTRVSCHVEEKKADWVYHNCDINNFIVEQTSQKVNKTLCIRSTTETNRQNKRPIGVPKTGNRDEKTRPKLPGCFDQTKIAPRIVHQGILLGHSAQNCVKMHIFVRQGKHRVRYNFFFLTSQELQIFSLYNLS